MPRYRIRAKYVVVQTIELDAASEPEARSRAITKLLGEPGWNANLAKKLDKAGLELESSLVHQFWDIDKIAESPSRPKKKRSVRKQLCAT